MKTAHNREQRMTPVRLAIIRVLNDAFNADTLSPSEVVALLGDLVGDYARMIANTN